MSWHQIVGKPGYATGTAGTATVPSGAIVHLIVVHASAGSASFTIFGGSSIAVINGAAPLVLQFQHTLWQSNSSNSGSIVFTNTDQYFVHWILEGNTP